MAFLTEGYSDERFQETVNDDLHCPICMNVLREPVHCGPNEHYFCKSCITTHLNTSKTCPCCQEKLSLDTVQPPPKFVTNRLNLLTISCDNANRGCEELVRLETLNDHVKNCGFSTVQCPNEGCRSVLNRKDYDRHVKKECEFRDQCQDCVDLRKELEKVKRKVEKSILELGAEKIKSEARCQDSITLKEEFREVKTMLQETKLEFYEHKQTVAQAVDYVRQDFIIIGGCGASGNVLNTVSIFRWSTMSWERLQPLRTARYEASVFTYDDEVIIAGGTAPSGDKKNTTGRTNRMENIRLVNPECTAQWSNYGIKLPVRKNVHKCLIHLDRLLVLGGYDDAGGIYEDVIHCIHMSPPFSPCVVARMPYPIGYFGAEIFGDKVVIVGGLVTVPYDTCLSTMTEYNATTNTFRDIPPLPFPVSHMTTVTWQDKLVVIGGKNKENRKIDSVVMYDVVSGRSTMLPHMLQKRSGASAISTGHVIVVMGGENETGTLNSAEYFNFSTYTWNAFPPLDTPRSYASAIVKPH